MLMTAIVIMTTIVIINGYGYECNFDFAFDYYYDSDFECGYDHYHFY